MLMFYLAAVCLVARGSKNNIHQIEIWKAQSGRVHYFTDVHFALCVTISFIIRFQFTHCKSICLCIFIRVLLCWCATVIHSQRYLKNLSLTHNNSVVYSFRYGNQQHGCDQPKNSTYKKKTLLKLLSSVYLVENITQFCFFFGVVVSQNEKIWKLIQRFYIISKLSLWLFEINCN